MSIQYHKQPNGIAARALAASGIGELLALSSISVDGGTQSRAALEKSVIEEYAYSIIGGAKFPPVVLFYDGSSYWLADGFHRFHAHVEAGAESIAADIRQGTRRDAILYSVGANADHGLRRTNEDKRRAVLTLLNDNEWAAWSDREIARCACVSDRFVNSLRASANSSQIDRKVERNGTTYTMNTAAIGKPTNEPDDEMDMTTVEATASEQTALRRGKLNIADDAHLDELFRQGMAREANGEDIDTVTKDMNLHKNYYRMACDVVFLFDRGGYSAEDATIVGEAFHLMVDERKIPEARSAIDPVAVKVWGSKDTRPRADREPFRLDRFEHVFGIVRQTCASAAEMEVPYLSKEAAGRAIKELKAARQDLQTLINRIEGLHA